MGTLEEEEGEEGEEEEEEEGGRGEGEDGEEEEEIQIKLRSCLDYVNRKHQPSLHCIME